MIGMVGQVAKALSVVHARLDTRANRTHSHTSTRTNYALLRDRQRRFAANTRRHALLCETYGSLSTACAAHYPHDLFYCQLYIIHIQSASVLPMTCRFADKQPWLLTCSPLVVPHLQRCVLSRHDMGVSLAGKSFLA